MVITLIAKNALKRPAYVEWSVYQSTWFNSALLQFGPSMPPPARFGRPFDVVVAAEIVAVMRAGPTRLYADRYCCFRQVDRLRRARFCRAGDGGITIARPYGTRIDPARIPSGFVEVQAADKRPGQTMMDRRPSPERKGHARYSIVTTRRQNSAVDGPTCSNRATRCHVL